NGTVAVDTSVYSRAESERLVAQGIKSAQVRNKHLTSVDKANALESSRLWLTIVEARAKDQREVTVDHRSRDAAAMKLVTNPASFAVIVTENLFGDILSDEASVLTGSIGMLPSASLSDTIGVYEPVHGSAPDIAGQGKANPLGMILSAAMMLRYSFEMEEEALAIETAVNLSLEQGYHTSALDIIKGEIVSTAALTSIVINNIRKN